MRHRVLLTYDDKGMQAIHRPFLEGFGYEVESADDALECLGKLMSNPPDILVLESKILWGGADGIIDRMQECPELYSIPVLLITEEGTPEELAEAVEDPVVACLQKPFTLVTFFHHILLAEGHTYKAFVERAESWTSKSSVACHAGGRSA